MSLKTNHILFLDFLFAYFTIYVICLYGLLSCKSRKLTLIWQDCTDLYLLWTIFSFFAFSFTFVISKIQKKNPENIAKTSIHSAVDVGPFRINAVKGNCLTCFPQHLWWNCSYSSLFHLRNIAADWYICYRNPGISINAVFVLIVFSSLCQSGMEIDFRVYLIDTIV